MSPKLKAPPKSNHPVDIGHRTEGAIFKELIIRGYAVLEPCGVNQRYDLVIEQDDGFLRCQVKTGRLTHGAIEFRTTSIRTNTKGAITRGYVDEVDFFLVHCPEIGGVYAIPVKKAPKFRMHLRVAPCSNNQDTGVHWAKDYELPA
jgi:hypothetical protein